MTLEDERMCWNFLNYVDQHDYAPEPWDDEVLMTAEEWVLDEYYPKPPWQKDLENVKKGHVTSIDNCVGEFFNFHLSVGNFLKDELRKNGKHIDIEMKKENWMDTADITFDEKNHVIKYAVEKEKCSEVIKLKRIDSSSARDSCDKLGALLNEYYNKFDRVCESV